MWIDTWTFVHLLLLENWYPCQRVVIYPAHDTLPTLY